MTVYFTSDLHIGHDKVEHARRPLVVSWWQEGGRDGVRHDTIIRDMLRETLTKRDQLWILGDISSGGSGGQRAALTMLKGVRDETGVQLHLIPGNHDGCHPQHRTAKKWWPEYLEVFDTIMPFASRSIAGQKVCLSHYPYIGDHTEEDRHTQWRLRDEGRWLLHGHTHQRLAYTKAAWGINGVSRFKMFPIGIEEFRELPPDDDEHVYDDVVRTKMINVGVDAWGFKPVALETIAEIIEQAEEGGL